MRGKKQDPQGSSDTATIHFCTLDFHPPFLRPPTQSHTQPNHPPQPHHNLNFPTKPHSSKEAHSSH